MSFLCFSLFVSAHAAAINLASAPSKPAINLFYKPSNALHLAKKMESEGKNPASFLDNIPMGRQGAEWVLKNTPLARDISPSVIIGGIGESGSRAIKFLLENLGVSMCDKTNERGDNFYTALGVMDHLKGCVEAGGGELTMEAYSKNPNEFLTLVKEEIRGVYETRKCITDKGKSAKIWGFKNPRQALMLPVIKAAFANKPKMIIAVRDPRDVCSAKNQDQFEEYCPFVLKKKKCEARVDCYSFWAQLHYQIFELYSKKQNVCLIRLEDLMGDPMEKHALSPGITRRVTNALGLNPSYERAVEVLQEIHKFNNSLIHSLMFHDHTDEELRHKLLKETAFHSDPRVKQVMKHLGYSPIKWELIQPQSKMLC